MIQGKHFFTSESVSMGHPDKLCDQISDAVLDAMIEQDKNSRVACECLATTGLIVVAGEITSAGMHKVDVGQLARDVVCDIGYDNDELGINGKTCGVVLAFDKQSSDIALGVDSGEQKEQGAGDQGMMFGFANSDTPEFMPLPIQLAQQLVEELARIRRAKELPYLRPDSKSQVTVEYDGEKPVRVSTVVISTQHDDDVTLEAIKSDLTESLIRKVIPAKYIDDKLIIHVNPTGRFVIGGPHGDTGLTGRKIIVDTYGGMGRHGGGAFSGKDPSKVDRSAAYMSRYIAKNIVAAGLASRCEVQLAYAIGIAEPMSVYVDTFGTAQGVEDKTIAGLVREHFQLTPAGIIEALNLKRPIYRQTAVHGHFGRELPDFTWERTDKADTLRTGAGR